MWPSFGETAAATFVPTVTVTVWDEVPHARRVTARKLPRRRAAADGTQTMRALVELICANPFREERGETLADTTIAWAVAPCQ